MNTNEIFSENLLRSTVILVRANNVHGMPDRFGSGMLLDYGNTRLLLTAGHVTRDQGRWAIQLRYAGKKGTELYGIGPMNFLAKMSLGGPDAKLSDIDFAYARVPKNLQPLWQEVDPVGNKVKREVPIAAIASDLAGKPNADENYGFCGAVMHTSEEHFGQAYLGADVPSYTGLKYVRTEDDFHYFALPFTHPGHDFFSGCSGAPILSESGELVALVIGGDEKTNEIWGVSVASYKTPIDILVGNI